MDDILAEYSVDEPPVPVDDLAERRGLFISYKSLDDDLAGFLLRTGGRCTIGVNPAHSLQRQRFTIAHEFAHALLHEGDELHVDRDFRVNFRSPVSSTAKNVEEIEANTFAASLLMPAKYGRPDTCSLVSGERKVMPWIVPDSDPYVSGARESSFSIRWANIVVKRQDIKITRRGWRPKARSPG